MQRRKLINIMVPDTPYQAISDLAKRLVATKAIVSLDAFLDQHLEPLTPEIEVINLHGSLTALPVLPEPAFPVFFVRPGWDYFVDSYNGHAHNPNSPAHWFASTVSMSEYAEHLCSLRQNNFQTRWLIGPHGLNEVILDMTALSHVVNVIEASDGLVIPQEHLQEGLILLAHRMGWPINAFPKLDLPKSPQITSLEDEALQETVTQVNHLDQKLYRYATIRLQRQIVESGLDIRKIIDTQHRLKLAESVANDTSSKGSQHGI